MHQHYFESHRNRTCHLFIVFLMTDKLGTFVKRRSGRLEGRFCFQSLAQNLISWPTSAFPLQYENAKSCQHTIKTSKKKTHIFLLSSLTNVMPDKTTDHHKTPEENKSLKSKHKLTTEMPSEFSNIFTYSSHSLTTWFKVSILWFVSIIFKC